MKLLPYFTTFYGRFYYLSSATMTQRIGNVCLKSPETIISLPSNGLLFWHKSFNKLSIESNTYLLVIEIPSQIKTHTFNIICIRWILRNITCWSFILTNWQQYQSKQLLILDNFCDTKTCSKYLINNFFQFYQDRQ